MTNQQGAPEALRLAELLELAPEDGIEPQTAEDAAAELLRQHSENETLRVERERNLNSISVCNEIINKKNAELESLRTGYAAARLEIESLQARIKTMAEEHADELMVAHLDGRMRAAQPAPQQEAPYNHGPQAETVAEAARDVGKWLNERPNRPIDLRHVAMLCAHAQAAQEAQEPVAIIEHTLGGSIQYCPLGTAYKLPMGVQFNLYTGPQPAPASQGDALDTARLDWLDKNIFYRDMSDWDAKYGHGIGYNMWVLFAPKGAQGSARNIIDAARAAQEDKSHGLKT